MITFVACTALVNTGDGVERTWFGEDERWMEQPELKASKFRRGEIRQTQLLELYLFNAFSCVSPDNDSKM